MVDIAWIDDERGFGAGDFCIRLSDSKILQRVESVIMHSGGFGPRLDGCGCRIGYGVVMFEGVGSLLRHCWSGFVARGDEFVLVHICCSEVQEGCGTFVGIVRRSRTGLTSTLIDDLKQSSSSEDSAAADLQM